MVRMRVTKGKRNKRRSHHALSSGALVQESGVYRLTHRASRKTGMYRGKQVLRLKEKVSQKEDTKATSEISEIPQSPAKTDSVER